MVIDSTKLKSNKIFMFKCLLFTSAILGSFVISMFLIVNKANQIYYDEIAYASLARAIQTNGFLTYYDSLRTYGYPLALAILDNIRQTLLAGAPLTVFVACTQFVLHTLAACLSVGCLNALMTADRKVRWQFSLICFTFVQFTPILLGLTSNFLTDNISVFLFTLFIYYLLTPNRYGLIRLNTTLASIIVVRPFYALWATLLALVIGAKYILGVLRNKLLKLGPSSRTVRPITFRRLIRLGLYTLVPFVGIVGLQYVSEYKAEKRLDLVGKEANSFISLHLADAMYTFKYETYVGGTDHPAQVFYLDKTEKERSEELAKQLGVSNPWSFSFKFPIQAIQIFSVKTIGMFQNYQWQLYRTNLENPINFIFLYGLALFVLFLYVNLSFVTQFRPRILQFAGWTPGASLVLIGIDLHIFMYSIPTVPEGRFVAPIIPVLVSLAAYLWITRRNFRTLFAAIAFAVPLYFWAYQVLLSSLT